MGHPTGSGPEHDPSQGRPHQGWVPQGSPPGGYPQQGYPQQAYPRQSWPDAPQPGWDPGVSKSPGRKPPGGGRSGRALAIVGAVSVLLVAVLVVVSVIALRHNGSEDGAAVSAAGSSSVDSPTTGDSPTSGESPSTAGSECPPPKAGPSTPAGWKTVAGKRGLSYDVPSNWTVETCSTLIGWESKCADGPFGFCTVRTMSGAASLDTAQCPKNSVGMAGTPGASNTGDINAAVRAEAGLVPKIYTSDSGRVPRVSLSAPENLTVGGAPAVRIVATVTDIETSACVGPTAVHSMVATTVPGQKGSVMFVISLPQGVSGAVDPKVGDQMVSTLRRSG